MAYVLEQIINGFCQGSIFALFAIGFALIAGVTGLATFTHGEVVMTGAFTVYYFSRYISSNLFLNIIIVFFITGLLGIVIHKICYERFFNAPHYIPLVCTIAMSMILKNLVQIFLGSETKAMPQTGVPGFISLGTIRINWIQITVICVVVFLCAALWFFLNKTTPGRILRAVSNDKTAAALAGINVGRATLLGNVIGCGIGGMGGALYAFYYSTFSPVMGLSISMKAFSSAVLGGMTGIASSAAGGVIIGIFENLGVMLFSSSLRDLVAFVFLIVVLLFMPEGLKLSRESKPGI
ncbi:MAG: branched-chain amino acid ABC transporter permease [Spirochaetaceae bacterium]|jgi:branched-chain amino acid transport system permease protein|nr:branched-chain amino acid ABC transporter permease [Spirochaetaceae bacterium]